MQLFLNLSLTFASDYKRFVYFSITNKKKEPKTKWKLWIFKLDYTFDAQAYIYEAIYAHIHTLWEFFDIESIARALEIYL